MDACEMRKLMIHRPLPEIDNTGEKDSEASNLTLFPEEGRGVMT
jgi:hypothetical protein